MANPKYSYLSQKLGAARRALMAPHPAGEATSYASAFVECELGLRDVVLDDLDHNARTWVATIQRIMNTAGFMDRWNVRAEQLSELEKYDFSSAVDQLAYWFYDRSYGIH